METSFASTSGPRSRRPVLIAAFRGWNDGGQARDARGRHARAQSGRRRASPRSTPRASSTSRRHARTVSLDDGMTRRIDWPENAFYAARDPRRRARRGDPARRRAELSLAGLQRARHRARPRPGCRARRDARRAARRRAPHAAGAGHRAPPATRRSSRSSACSRRATRGRPGSSACSTTRAARRASPR